VKKSKNKYKKGNIMTNKKLLIVISVVLIGIFGIMLMNQDDSIGDQIGEGVEEVGDEIDDAVSQ